MAVTAWANNSVTTVTLGGTTAPAPGATETWTVSSPTSFPAASATAVPPSQFHVADPALAAEKMTVTAVSGSTWTVTRGAEGTTPLAHAPGFTVVATATAGDLTALRSPDWLNVVNHFGADPTGTTDSSAAMQAALTASGAFPSGGCGVYFPAGTYKFGTGLTVPYQSKVLGDGIGTVLAYTGSGTAVSMHNPNSPSNNTYYQFPGGSIEDLVIDGTSAGAGATGLSIGDAWGLGTRRVRVQDFTGAGSIGYTCANLYTWTEKGHFQASVVNCSTLVVLAGPSSFEYNHWDFDVYAVAGQNGLQVSGGAYISGSDLRMVGNFQSSASSLASNWAVQFTGSGGSGPISSGAARGVEFRVRLELGGNLANGPQTVNFGAAGNTIKNCYGALWFNAGAGQSWVASNCSSTPGNQFTFGGVVNDSALLAGNAKPTGWL